MNNVPSSTWREYSEIQALLTQHWIEQIGSQDNTIAREYAEKENNGATPRDAR